MFHRHFNKPHNSTFTLVLHYWSISRMFRMSCLVFSTFPITYHDFLHYKLNLLMLVCFILLGPTPGHWGRWSYYSCDTKCGRGGTRKRFRRCDDPPPMNNGSFCPGAALETKEERCFRGRCNLSKIIFRLRWLPIVSWPRREQVTNLAGN